MIIQVITLTDMKTLFGDIIMKDYPGCTVHQIGPYIGKLRPYLARKLVADYSGEGDWIWDPFCGSGTIPLESRLLNRHIIASDINPYACILTQAKLHAPQSKDIPIKHLEEVGQKLSRPRVENYLEAPSWVKKFFHERTLLETQILAANFIKNQRYFNLGCLLDILHHQRPGFLSFPASHLVPYLRDKRYPRESYPEAYEYRDPVSRLREKIRRVFRNPPPPLRSRFRVLPKSVLDINLPADSIDAVITSPPYMDALDYVRDNRLRLWFLGVSDYHKLKNKEIGRISSFKADMTKSLLKMSKVLKRGGFCILILGDVTRARRKYDVPQMIYDVITKDVRNFVLKEQWGEGIPDQRRARRNGKATKNETILVFQRKD